MQKASLGAVFMVSLTGVFFTEWHQAFYLYLNTVETFCVKVNNYKFNGITNRLKEDSIQMILPYIHEHSSVRKSIWCLQKYEEWKKDFQGERSFCPSPDPYALHCLPRRLRQPIMWNLCSYHRMWDLWDHLTRGNHGNASSDSMLHHGTANFIMLLSLSFKVKLFISSNVEQPDPTM